MRLAFLVQDFRFALRQLRRSPAVSLAMVITLALGMGANTAMFSIVDAWLLRPLPLKDPQRLVAVWRTDPKAPREPQYFNLYHDYAVWAASNRTMESLAGTFDEPYVLTGEGDAVELHGAVATWNLFSTVGVQAEIGHLFNADDYEDGPACVISHALWVERFHQSRDVIGRSIHLNGELYRVLGVLPSGFSLHILDRSFEHDVWVLITASNPAHTATSTTPVAVIGRLKSGVTPAQAEADITGMQRELNTRFHDYPPNFGVLVTGLQEDNTRAVRASLLLLFAAVGVLLLIACVNASSLILGRNARRETEFAVRAALGCSVRRLLQQLTTEVLVIFVIGGALGVLFAIAALRAFMAVNPLGALPPGGVQLSGVVLGVSGAVVFITALLFGAVPAVRAHLKSRRSETLHVRAATANRSHLRSRMVFVAMEFALSVMLLVAAGLLIKSFAKIQAEPLGFRTHQVYVASVALPYRTYSDVESEVRFTDNALANLRTVPSATAVGVARTWPFEVNGLNPIELEGSTEPVEQMRQAARFVVGPGYFDALGVPVLRGRTFTEDDRTGALPVAIINDAFASQTFHEEDPIGKHIRVRFHGESTASAPWVTIVGVVGTTRSLRYNHIDWNAYPAVYTSEYQLTASKGAQRFASRTLYFYVNGATVAAREISTAIHEVDPDLAVGDVQSTEHIVAELRSQPRIRATMTGSFGLLTLVLTAVGIYGAITQMVEQRGREIGIRMAIGATVGDVQRLVMKRALGVTVAGICVGLAAAAAASRVVRSFLYGTTALDPSVIAVVIAVLAAIAVLGSYVPMRRAVRIDPSITLRSE